MSVSLSPNLPANVVEIGNEISQAKINEINAGTLALQTWVTSGFAPKASPTFTGTVTIPAGASISGYLTTANASSLYQTISGMSSYLTTANAQNAYAGKFDPATGNYGVVYDVPNDGVEYVRKNQSWVTATGGGGGVAWGAITGTVTDQTDLTTYIGGLGYQTASDVSTYVTGLGYITSSALTVTNIDLTGNFNGYSMGSGYYSFKYDSTANTLRMQDGVGSGITISATAITFPDSTTISTAPVLGSMSVNTQSSSYTLVLSDANNIVYIPNGSSPTITIPYDSSVSFAIGTEITIVFDGSSSGSVSFQPQDTMTPLPVLVNFSTMTTSGVKKIVKVGTDLWISQ